MTQVRENTESLNRQYELVERAHRLGWPASEWARDSPTVAARPVAMSERQPL